MLAATPIFPTISAVQISQIRAELIQTLPGPETTAWPYLYT